MKIVCVGMLVVGIGAAWLPGWAMENGLNWGDPKSAIESRILPTVGTGGMVVADDRIASEWGAEILREGGNAIDAAVATAFAMSVTRPHYAALGGGGFLLYCPAPKKKGSTEQRLPCESLDFRETAPSAATQNLFLEKKDRPLPSQNGPLALGTPGLTAGLLASLESFGTLTRQKLLSKPIQLAKEGHLLSTNTESAILDRWEAMNPSAKEIFGCGSPIAPCPPGTLIRQPDLAKVLEKISHEGAKGFYEGEVARKIVRGIQQKGGILSLSDLKTYKPVFRMPLAFNLSKNLAHPNFAQERSQNRGIPRKIPFEIVTMSPPSAGGINLAQLFFFADKAARAGYFAKGIHSSSAIHALAEAMGLAFADRAKFLGDPDFSQIPLAQLTDTDYLTDRWKLIKPDQSALATVRLGLDEDTLREHPETTHLVVIDKHGNTVSMTVTLNENLGSGFVPPGTGVVMNNQMDDFNIQAGTPNYFGLVTGKSNSVAPRKRPLSSMTPVILRDLNGHPRIAIGAAGGPRITTSVFLSLLNRIYFGLSLADAIALPRFHLQWPPDFLELEAGGFSGELQELLEQKGHHLKIIPKSGRIHSLEVFPNGRVWGIADPRSEGAAIPE